MPRTAADRKVAKAQHRREQAARRARAKREAAEREEARQEAIVPAAQRQPVLAADGSIIRRARVQVDGPAFVKSSALCHIASRNTRITAAHIQAADRLAKAAQRSETITIGSANYGERTSGRVQSGVLSGYVQAIVDGQIEAAQEVVGARKWLGRWWPVVSGIVIDGQDATAWGHVHGVYRETAVKMLIVGLNRLVAFYEALKPARRGRIRAAEIVPRDEIPIRTIPPDDTETIRAAHFS